MSSSWSFKLNLLFWTKSKFEYNAPLIRCNLLRSLRFNCKECIWIETISLSLFFLFELQCIQSSASIYLDTTLNQTLYTKYQLSISLLYDFELEGWGSQRKNAWWDIKDHSKWTLYRKRERINVCTFGRDCRLAWSKIYNFK